MAKKNEFQPDKPKLGLIDRLHMTRQQRRVLLKWVLYAAVLVFLSLLQDVILCHLRVFGASTELVPCAIFLICLLEGTESGSVFGLVASCLYLFSGTAPGVYSLVILTFLAVFATFLRQAYLQKGFASAMLCTVPTLFAYEILTYAFGLFLGLTHPSRILGFLITAGLTSLTAPVLYPLFLRIGSIGGEPWKE